ncbi:PREDICTED: V-set and immunoglobulin domain-containing protein 10 [Chaetura pelagica]|uniref:V-set and immunoglobulin domain-containing protein 10 n=1 Tax=Chaetura pelagica TaxID=8897 RepID=UPI00052356DF|nr:PREDICTED: V-set and immunoglobulin domain-containing protein 10 [Chaetura pelagica]
MTGGITLGHGIMLLKNGAETVPVSKPFVHPTVAAAAEGTVVALTCAVREGTEPLSFSWHHQEPRGGPSAYPPGLEGFGPQLHLTPANRSHAGWYTCTVGNQVNNQTSEPVYLDIVYGPDEPAISVEPFSPEPGGFSVGEREDVVLSCLAPSNPPSRYIWLHNGSQVHTGQTYIMAAITRAQAGTYTCLAENTHLQTRTQATILLTIYWIPAGGPLCTAVATKGDDYVMLRCWWEGGTPPVTLHWWDGEGKALGDPGLSSAVLVLSAAGSLGGRDFVCMAAHPLRPAGADCRLRLEVPELEAERSEVVVLEGGEARLACRRRGSRADLGATLAWYDPEEREVTPGMAKYRVERGEDWVNLTVQDAEWPRDGVFFPGQWALPASLSTSVWTSRSRHHQKPPRTSKVNVTTTMNVIP